MSKNYIEFKTHYGTRIAVGLNESFMVHELSEKYPSRGAAGDITTGSLVYLRSFPAFVTQDFYLNVLTSLSEIGTPYDQLVGAIKNE